MAIKDNEFLNKLSNVTLQDLHELRLNPFAVQLLVESYRDTVQLLGEAKSITFVYYGVEISLKPHGEKEEPLDWEQAKKYFDKVRQRYQELAGTPGVNTSLALEHVFRPIAERYERGERTVELYREMISVE